MIANYHTHTPRCGHAVGMEEEYVAHARENGLKILGFSDHTPYLFPGDYYSDFRMRPEQLSDYATAVRRLQKRYAGVLDIHLGVEAEYYPAFFADTVAFLREHGVEYLLLGQHCCGNEIGGRYSGVPTDREEHLREYCYQTMEAMNTGLFTYFAHPDMFRFVGSDEPYTRYTRELCREANRCGIPLELNLLGVRDNRHYPTRRFWEIAAEEGCATVLGMDAHTPSSLDDKKQLETARLWVEELGLKLLDTVELRSIL